MATYAIGDVQGCYTELRDLLTKIRFRTDRDQLWFVGDLVNRGPDSLKVLRFVRSITANSVVVLGNHDLHLLSCRYLDRFNPTKKDTTTEILNATDCDDLLLWLRQQKLAYYDPTLNFTMIHAGLPPSWSVKDAIAAAAEVEHHLCGENFIELLDNMYGNEPNRWSPELKSWPRFRFIINALTRLRFCDVYGQIDLKYKGPLGSQPASLKPWFELNRRPKDQRVVFGHWSSLRLSVAEQEQFAVYPIDTGAVWGNCLTALRLDDCASFATPSSVLLPT